jgi:hypothetical protein
MVELNAAYQEIAQELGEQFDAYHPISYMNPYADENYISSTLLAYAPDKSFEQSMQLSFKIYQLYADQTGLVRGDILKNNDYIFVILENDQVSYPIGIRCDVNLSFYRPFNGRDVLGHAELQEVQYAKTVPANLQPSGNAAIAKPYHVPAAVPEGGINKLNYYTVLPRRLINPGDVIVDDLGNRSVITQVNDHFLGTEIYSTLSNKP